MVLKTISPGCGVRASLMLFLSNSIMCSLMVACDKIYISVGPAIADTVCGQNASTDRGSGEGTSGVR